MPKRTAVQKRARELQLDEGLGYQEALNRARAEAEQQPDPAALPLAYVLQPTQAEAAQGITAEELGVRALPADATPAQRAHAEAVWRVAEAGQPCRCCGVDCRHGTVCAVAADGSYDVNAESCTGQLIHADRIPGSMFDPTAWLDTYKCPSCGSEFDEDVEIPALPWGEATSTEHGRAALTVYDNIRHPNFRTDDGAFEAPNGDGTCRECGGYAFEGLLCDSCRSKGWTDAYGEIEPPSDEDEDPLALYFAPDGEGEEHLASPAVLLVDRDPQPTVTTCATRPPSDEATTESATDAAGGAQ